MTSNAHLDFGGALEVIYEAAALPNKWPDVLTMLSTRFGSQAALFLSNTPDGLFGYESDTDWRIHRSAYNAAGWAKDTTRYDWLLSSPYSGFRTDLDFVSYRELLNIPVYREFLIPRKIDAGAATLLPGLNGDELLFSLEAFPSHEKAREALPFLDQLRPHLARAAMLAARLRITNAKAAISALEIADIGAALVANNGRITQTNSIFDNTTSGLLKFIEKFIKNNIMTGQEIGQVNSGSIPIKVGSDFALLHAIPICGDSRDIFIGSSHFLIIRQRRTIKSSDSHLIREMYDLTQNETNVAISISSGKRIDEIASERQVSVQTIRSQLKSIFQKLDIHNQTDLALCLSNILAY